MTGARQENPQSITGSHAGRRSAGPLWALLCVAILVRLAFCHGTSGLGTAPPIDYREYILVGKRLLEHGTLVSALILPEGYTEPSALLPPVYVGLVAAVYKLLGVESTVSTLVLQLINILAATAVVGVAYRIAHVLAGRLAGLIAAIIVTCNPVAFGFVHLVWDTSLFTLGVALSVLWSLGLRRRSVGTAEWLAFGAWLGLLALLNPALTSAYPLLVLWPMCSGHRTSAFSGHGLKIIAVTVFGWALAISPWVARNYIEFERLIYIRNGFMQELWLGVSPEADEHIGKVFRDRFPLKSPVVQARVQEIGEQAFLHECGENAQQAIRNDPARYLRLVVTRFVDFWLGTVNFTATGGRWSLTSLRGMLAIGLSLQTLLIVLWLILGRRRSRDVWWLVAIALAFCIVYCITHVQLRFRTPIEPIVAVIVAIMLSDLLGGRIDATKAHGSRP